MDERTVVGLLILAGIGWVLLKTPVGTYADAEYWYALARVDAHYAPLAIHHLQVLHAAAQQAGNTTEAATIGQLLNRLGAGTFTG
jgi:hypothetical protein